MSKNRNNIFIDVKSANSIGPLTELINEAYDANKIYVCQYSIGSHMSPWRKAKIHDEAIYAIDDIGIAGGEITYLCKRAFRPRWIPDNTVYKSLLKFCSGLCPKQFNQSWNNHMKEQHWEAIDKKRWLFFALAVIDPSYRLTGNKKLLLDKVKEMSEAEDELEKEAARWAMGSYMEGEGYAG